MFTHAPKDYDCPFCILLAGGADQYTTQEDIVYRGEGATAFIAPKWWPNNPGGVLVVANQHYENIYDTPDAVLGEVYAVVRQVSIAMRRTYDGCQGTSNRQHNEPAGRQNVWHLHVHVFPRYDNDLLYKLHDESEFVSQEKRSVYAQQLRTYFTGQKA